MQAEKHIVHLNNNTPIAIYSYGNISAPYSIIFIHGLANYYKVWESNIEQLRTHFHCIAIDLPGNGNSPCEQKKYTIDFYTECMMSLIDILNVKKLILAGHSMGGMIAMKLALRIPHKINHLLLFAPAGFEYYSPHESTLYKSAITIGNFLHLDETQIRNSVITSFYKNHPLSDIFIADLSRFLLEGNRSCYRGMLEDSVFSMLDDDVFNYLNNINTPTHVFFGENDMLIPNRFLHPVSTKDIATNASKKIPHCVLHTYRNTGHFVQIEQATQINEIIKSIDFSLL